MKSQKEGVYDVVTNFLRERGKEFEDGMKVELNKDERKVVVLALISATEAGELEVKSEKASKDLKQYWNGTLSNWLRKDERLNGGVEHAIKNPGSRAGAGDATLKNLKILLSKVEKAEDKAKVEAAIEERKAKIAAEKAKQVEINVDVLPEHLRHLAS